MSHKMASGVRICTVGLLGLTLLLATQKTSATGVGGYIVDSGLDVATEKLLNSFQHMLHDVSSAQSMSEFTRELTGSVMQLLHHVPPSLVSVVVETQTKVASTNEALPNADNESCTRDYTPMCPENYVDTGDGIHCKALQSYMGNCDKILDMSDKTPRQKRETARSCGVQWKCHATCPQEFSFACPWGWIDLGDMLCQAPDTYTGRCVRQKSFKDFDETMKEQWAAECGVHWPCKKQNFDFSSKLCPIDWTEADGKRCVSPAHYVGPCDATIPIGEMSNEEKLKLAFLCKLQWPSKAKLDYEFSAPCPVGWEQLTANYADCKPPLSYQGPCNRIQSFANFNVKEKYEWAQKCGATWPFKDSAERDYGPSAFCPMGWNLLDKATGLCESPPSYKGRCSSPFSFKNYSPEMKASWAHVCEASFEPTAISTLKKLAAFPKPTVEPYLGPESAREGVVGLPGSPLWGRVLAANGTVYLSSGTSKSSASPPIKPSFTASELVATERHIEELKRIKQRETNPQINSAIEDAIAQLKSKGGNENIVFSFMQKHAGEYYFDQDIYWDQLAQSYMAQQDPLTGGAVESTEHECVRDYYSCPKRWRNLDNIWCMAPDSYIENGGTCNTVVEFGRMADKYGTRNIAQIKKWARECGAEFPCVQFEHDYVRSPCPVGWRHIRDGHCVAPANYPDHLKERCGTEVNFKYAVPEYRRSWARICGADWPVAGICEADYSQPCPLGFVRTGLLSMANKCSAQGWRSDFQEEVCRSPLIVPDDPVTKRDISNKCGTPWGCVGQCEMDFWQKCPYGWMYKQRRCHAPPGYLPPPGCSRTFKADSSIFGFFGRNEHKLYKNVARCNAPWPCKGSCQQDWREPCPRHWKEDKMKLLHGRTVCKPPQKYEGPCGGNPQDLTGYTFAQKQEFAFRCGVQWKCGGTTRHFGITLRTKPGWQTEDAYRDKNWESLNTVESIYDPPISPEEQLHLREEEM